MPKTFICKHCKKTITTKTRSNGRYEYCSRECSYNGMHGETVTDGVFFARSQNQLLALNLYNGGRDVRAAAKEAKIGADMLYDLILKNKAALSERTCIICNKPMTGMKQLGMRKYCSRGCKYIAARARQLASKAAIESAAASAEKAAHRAGRAERVVELYRKGYSQNEIVRIIGVTQGTISRDLRNHYRNVEPALYFERAFYKERKAAKTPDEWSATLSKYAELDRLGRDGGGHSQEAHSQSIRNQSPLNQETPHHLLIRLIRGTATQNFLTAIVCDEMKLNPHSGQVFVFCAKDGWIITTLAWDGEKFLTTKYNRDKSRYVWPHEGVGGCGGHVTITKSSFEFLLSYYKSNQKRRREYFEKISKNI